ncbi:MAG: glutamate synthase [Ignavibacteria bacterium GWB2_36_8]|nr:MAG: glutamate synthase [Ignavibacteria bacterium GWB2_36_8]
MGKPTGFMEYERLSLHREAIEKRVKHYKEFESSFTQKDAKTQGARCMDCGIPFCHGDTGCPVENYIPEWNDLIYKGHWQEALDNLHSTNNFPEFTGRLCPAPCESACVLGINANPVSIKAIEKTIIDHGFSSGWVTPRLPLELTGKKVAVIGSGPAGLAAAQQLARFGHSVTVYEKNDKIGGLLRYGIPDFKLEKHYIDRRLEQMKAEGVNFLTSCNVGVDISIKELLDQYDSIILAGGCEHPSDISIPGRNLKGIHFAMEYLPQQNRVNAGESLQNQISAKNKNVIIIGGGDTGSDCVGTANRQRALSITQLELLPQPPAKRSESTPWPYWALMLRTSSSHEEGVVRKWSINTKEFKGNDKGEVTALHCIKVKMENGKIVDIPSSDFELPADLVLIAAGFVHPVKNGLISELVESGMELDARGNVNAKFGDEEDTFKTNLDKVYTCGDMRRGQSLVVWAISEGRKCAASVHKALMAEKYEEAAA